MRVVIVILIGTCLSLALDAPDWNKVQKQRRSEGFIIEQVVPDATTSFIQIGASFDRFLSESFYVGGTALGAVAGGRGGYATGAFQAGVIQNIGPLIIDFRCLVGGSGGGGVPVKGGLFIQPMLGLEIPISSGLSAKASCGRYVSVDNPFQAWVWDVSIALYTQHLFIPIN